MQDDLVEMLGSMPADRRIVMVLRAEASGALNEAGTIKDLGARFSTMHAIVLDARRPICEMLARHAGEIEVLSTIEGAATFLAVGTVGAWRGVLAQEVEALRDVCLEIDGVPRRTTA